MEPKKSQKEEINGTDKQAFEADAAEIALEAAMTESAAAAEPPAPEVVEPPLVPGNGTGPDERPGRNLERILDIQLPVTVSFGSTRRPLSDILKFAPGSLIELDRGASEPVVLKVNGKVFAWGKVVDVDGYYGVEITEIINQVDRIASLGGE